MKNILKKSAQFVLILQLSNVFGQEGHLTQVFNSAIYINPAMAGSDSSARITSNYRHQWSGISNGFTTKLISADSKIGKFNYGLLLSSNDAGAESLKRNNFLGLMSHQYRLNTFNEISVGFQLGFTQYNLNTSSLKFDNQYSSTNGYDKNSSNGESFGSTNGINFTSGVGVHWKNTKLKWGPSCSFSMSNLVNSNQKFTSQLNPKPITQSTFYTELRKKLNYRTSFLPYFVLQSQANARTFLIGSRINYDLSTGSTIQLGTALRNKDAVLMYVGTKVKNVTIGLSYDITTSYLKKAFAGFGAWELGIIVNFNKHKNKKYSKNEKDLKKTLLTIEDDTILLEDKKTTNLDSTPILSKINLPLVNKNDTLKSNPLNDKKEVITKVVPLNDHSKNKNTFKSIDFKLVKKEQILSDVFVYFDSDKSIIKPAYKLKLDSLIVQLKLHSNYKILVSGHTDSDGTGIYNIYLGDARANKVMNYFVENGIQIDAIKTFTYGKSSPLADNKYEHTKSKNRRVEIVLVNQ